MSETIFTYAAPGLKFGPGAAQEIGFDLARQGVRRVLLITDEGLVAAGHPQAITESLASAGIACDTYSSTAVEPTSRWVVAALSTPPRPSTYCSPTPAS